MGFALRNTRVHIDIIIANRVCLCANYDMRLYELNSIIIMLEFLNPRNFEHAALSLNIEF